jgi:hypothetical protein
MVKVSGNPACRASFEVNATLQALAEARPRLHPWRTCPPRSQARPLLPVCLSPLRQALHASPSLTITIRSLTQLLVCLAPSPCLSSRSRVDKATFSIAFAGLSASLAIHDLPLTPHPQYGRRQHRRRHLR